MTARLAGLWAIDKAGTPPRPLRRGRVDDVEALVRGVVRGLTAGDPLPWADELLTIDHLFEQTILLQRKYDPNKAGILFRPWLFSELQRDAIDFWRTWHGRKGEKRVADASRLAAALRDSGFDDADPGLDRPDRAAAEGAVGAPGDRALPREFTDLPGDRGAAFAAAVGGLRRGEGQADPGRARRGGAAARRGHVGQFAGADRGAPPFLDCVSCGWRHYPSAPNGRPGWHFDEACVACGSPLELVPDYPPQEVRAA